MVQKLEGTDTSGGKGTVAGLGGGIERRARGEAVGGIENWESTEDGVGG